MTDETGWARDRIISIERDLGGMAERIRGAETMSATLRGEVKEDLVRVERGAADAVRSVTEIIMRENAHTRGEIERLDKAQQENRRRDEERINVQRRHDEAEQREQSRQLREELVTTQRANQRTIRWIVIFGLLANLFFGERLPDLMRLVSEVFG